MTTLELPARRRVEIWPALRTRPRWTSSPATRESRWFQWRYEELGGHGRISKSSPPFPCRTISPCSAASRLPSFLSHPSLSLHVLPFPPLPPPYFKPFLLHFSLPSPLQRLGGLWSAIAPPAGPGGARPPNAFLCNSQPQICKSVKSFTHVHKTPIQHR